MPHGRISAALVFTAALSLVVGTGSAADRDPGTDVYFGDGGVSPFYKWDGRLEKPGEMLRREPVGEGYFADHAAVAERILYASTDGRFGRGVIEASGLLYLPKGEAPKGGWPLIVWGHGTLGIADVCAPSWARPMPRDGHYIDAWVQQGFAVVAPDYQGLGTRGVHTYLQRAGEGYSVLDAARAALKAHPGLVANKVILTGQSQGSGAVLNATYLQPSYAPDVNLLGTVATALVWSAQPERGAAPENVGGADPRYAVMRMYGGGLHPNSPAPDTLLAPKGQVLREAARHGCSRDMAVAAKQNEVTADNAFTQSPGKVSAMLVDPSVPARRLPVPLLIATGLADSTIPTARQFAAVQQMCRRGNRVKWVKYDGVNHSGTVNYALRDAVPFARDLLAKRAFASNCDSITAPGPIQAADRSIPFQE
ncbi:lipase family protein [Novosphingobium sp. KACC 22771]|uniref:lipase family protein n=1 Tax=Novosphingobium sp. KACC 22771 TaxID=3025670 RepID=UPI00236574B4|nr:lipase family protein [Novosphingobium sp. KACC 22771]WDF73437.1 lipase family protein [Novosphingobium sp. KACC 22771]